MPNAKFDAKSFNPEAFKYIMDRIPRTRLNEIRKSKVLVGNPDIRAVLGTQNGHRLCPCGRAWPAGR